MVIITERCIEMRWTKKGKSLVLTLVILALLLASLDGLSSKIAEAHQTATLFGLVSEPPYRDGEGTSLPVAPRQLNTRDVAMLQGTALLIFNTRQIRSFGNNWDILSSYLSGLTCKPKETIFRIYVPNTVFGLMKGHICHYLDIPPPTY